MASMIGTALLAGNVSNARPAASFQACPVQAAGDVAATDRGGTGLAVATADAQGTTVQVTVSGAGGCAAFPLTGASTPGGALDEPRGVAFGPQDRIFVSDTGNDRILRYGSVDGLNFGSPIPFQTVVEPTLGQSQVFDAPEGLTADASGRLYVADTGNQRVVILSSDGQIDATVGPTVAVDPTSSGFAFIALDTPSDVAVCGDSAAPEYRGRYFVADRGQSRIHVFDHDNEYLFQFGRSGDAVNDFNAPQSVAVDAECVVYVADTQNNRIQVFTPDGAVLEVIGTALDPAGVAVVRGRGLFVGSAIDGGTDRFTDISYDVNNDGRIDDDRDGIPDRWEDEGIDLDFDGTPELDLPALGARVDRRDIFLEIDAMAGRPLSDGVADDIVAAFADAPIDNPDGSTGIVLHIQTGMDTVPFRSVIGLTSDSSPPVNFGDIYQNFFGSPADRAAPNAEALLFARSLVYRYALIANTACRNNNPNNPNICVVVPNSGFAFRGGRMIMLLADTLDRDLQARVLMHELGHTLGLGHGGGDNQSCKPNYLSIMNYRFAGSGVLSDEMGRTLLDFSRAKLDTLDEESLDESVGLNHTCALRTRWNVNGGEEAQFGLACGPLNWSDTPFVATGGGVNLTNDPSIADCSDAVRTELEGHDDWTNLSYDFRRQSSRRPRESSSIFDGISEESGGVLEFSREELMSTRLCSEFGLCGRPPFEYAAKFVCGAAEPAGFSTSVNIHNPNADTAGFLLKLALDSPEVPFEPGPIVDLGPHLLAYDEVMSVDCGDVSPRLADAVPVGAAFEGMLVAQSAASFDVQAIYSGRARGAAGRSYDPGESLPPPIHVMVVPERQIGPAGDGDSQSPSDEPGLPDLVPEDVGEGPATVGEDRFCRFRSDSNGAVLVVAVANGGTEPSDGTVTNLVFGPSLEVAALTPAILPGASATLEVAVPQGWPNAEVTGLRIVADGGKAVAEESETNNEVDTDCKPLVPHREPVQADLRE